MHTMCFTIIAMTLTFTISCLAQDLSLSLNSAIEISLNSHPDLKAAQQEIRRARGQAWQRWSLQNPSLVWEHEGILKGNRFNNAEVKKLKFLQTIDFPSNILLAGKAADQNVHKKEFEYEIAKLRIIGEVKLAYWKLIAEEQHQELAKKNVLLAEDFLAKAKRRYEVGEAANLEYIKARVEKARTENTLTQAYNAVQVARAELNTLLVRDIQAPLSLADSLIFVRLELNLAELKKSAFINHPKLNEAKTETQMANIGRTLAWGSFLPAFEFGYFQQTIAGVPDFWGATVGLSLPLWFSIKQRGIVQEASAVLRKTEFEYNSLKNKIELQIETAFAKTKTAETQVQLFQKELLTEAEEVYRIAQRSYGEGESSYLELLDAQRTLIQVRSDYIHHLLDYYSALSQLEQAVGGRLFDF